jgi:hypothetical protein
MASLEKDEGKSKKDERGERDRETGADNVTRWRGTERRAVATPSQAVNP